LELTGMTHLSEHCGREEAPSVDRAPSIDAVRGCMGEDGRDCKVRGEDGGARPLGMRMAGAPSIEGCGMRASMLDGASEAGREFRRRGHGVWWTPTQEPYRVVGIWRIWKRGTGYLTTCRPAAVLTRK
jgi:hypothetical protein